MGLSAFFVPLFPGASVAAHPTEGSYRVGYRVRPKTQYHVPLTDVAIRRAKPQEPTEGGSLHLFITAAGAKSWRWKYSG